MSGPILIPVKKNAEVRIIGILTKEKCVGRFQVSAYSLALMKVSGSMQLTIE